MPSTAAAKAKAKSTPAAPPTVITIAGGQPDQPISYVNVGGTARFDNSDSTDYRIRLWEKKHRKHPLIDVFLPAVGSITLMADPLAKKKDECRYDVLATNLLKPSDGGVAASGGGGKIIIGPTPGHRQGGG
jgi:hypothetical protein